MSIGWRAASAVLDAGTAACATANSIYFLDRLLSRGERSSGRRAAVLVLTMLSLGALLEATALLAMAALTGGSGMTASATWTAVRVLPFAGTAGLAALVARRVAGR